MAVLSWKQNKKDVPSGLDFCLDFLVNVLAQSGHSRTCGIELLAAGRWFLVFSFFSFKPLFLVTGVVYWITRMAELARNGLIRFPRKLGNNVDTGPWEHLESSRQ